MRKVFEYEQILSDFFRQYGSPVCCEDSQEIVFGVLTRWREGGSDQAGIRFEQAGFLPKREYQLILPPDCTFFQKGRLLSVDGKRLRVLSTECYFLAGNPMYQKGDCCEVKGDFV